MRYWDNREPFLRASRVGTLLIAEFFSCLGVTLRSLLLLYFENDVVSCHP